MRNTYCLVFHTQARNADRMPNFNFHYQTPSDSGTIPRRPIVKPRAAPACNNFLSNNLAKFIQLLLTAPHKKPAKLTPLSPEGGGSRGYQHPTKFCDSSADMAQHHTIAKAVPPWYDRGMNQPLDIPFRTRGRAARSIAFAEVRLLDGTDLAMLSEEKGVQAPALKRLSDRHHALARCLSSGMSEGDAALACGYVSSRVSILKSDPAFQELLAFYRDDTDRAYRDMHERLAGLSRDAVDELHTRLEDDIQAEEKKISVGQLLEIAKMGSDRTGYGPQSSQTVNVNVGIAAKLEAARRRVADRSAAALVIEG